MHQSFLSLLHHSHCICNMPFLFFHMLPLFLLSYDNHVPSYRLFPVLIRYCRILSILFLLHVLPLYMSLPLLQQLQVYVLSLLCWLSLFPCRLCRYKSLLLLPHRLPLLLLLRHPSCGLPEESLFQIHPLLHHICCSVCSLFLSLYSLLPCQL